MQKDLYRVGDCPLLEAMEQMDRAGFGALFILDENGRMIGMLTDGDIRKALLRRMGLDASVYAVMNRDFTFWPAKMDREQGVQYLRGLHRRHMPVLDEDRKLIDILLLDEWLFQTFDNPVVLMAGGLGTRLLPLTKNRPKPLLKVGNKPLLETIITNFIENGFRNFFISVNYKSEMIENYFKDGEQWKINIQYLRESKPLGTAGALSLLPEKPEKPFFVMNGDILTKINVKQLLEFHNNCQASATMCVKEYEFKLPYGLINLESHRIVAINEKPVQTFFVNAGIYVLSPETMDFIPQDEFFDMPQLFDKLIKKGYLTVSFPIREYWLDIGQVKDFERANGEFDVIFGNDHAETMGRESDEGR